MVVTDWLGWWWWVYIVWRRTDRNLSPFPLSLFSFGRFIPSSSSSSSSASSFHRSIHVVCALDLAWDKERDRCAFVYYRLKRGETYNDLRTFIYIYIYTYVHIYIHSRVQVIFLIDWKINVSYCCSPGKFFFFCICSLKTILIDTCHRRRRKKRNLSFVYFILIFYSKTKKNSFTKFFIPLDIHCLSNMTIF